MNLEQIKQNKSVTKADIKFITEFIKPLEEQEFINPYSKESVVLSEYMAGLVGFTQDLDNFNGNRAWIGWKPSEMKDNLAAIHPSLTPRNWVSKFDRARHLILKLNSSVYMTLID